MRLLPTSHASSGLRMRVLLKVSCGILVFDGVTEIYPLDWRRFASFSNRCISSSSASNKIFTAFCIVNSFSIILDTPFDLYLLSWFKDPSDGDLSRRHTNAETKEDWKNSPVSQSFSQNVRVDTTPKGYFSIPGFMQIDGFKLIFKCHQEFWVFKQFC